MNALPLVLHTVPRRLNKAPRILYPRNAMRTYRRDLYVMLDAARELVHEKLLPLLPSLIIQATGRRDAGDARADEYSDAIAQTFGNIRVEYQRIIPDTKVEGTAKTAADATNTHNSGQVNNQVRTVLGVDVFRGDANLQADAKAFVKQNVSLIKSVPGRYLDDIEQIVLQNVTQGRRASEIAEQIEQRFDVARSRADFIAQDQVGKFNGLLTERRHTALGLVRYRWRNSRDERVRGNPAGKYPHAKHSHWNREGKLYEYSAPPADGNPGQPPRCRCWGEPAFEDILPKKFAVDQTPAPVASAANVFRAREKIRKRSSAGETVITPEMSLLEAEDAIRRRRVEHIGAYTPSGELLHTGVGTAAAVPVPTDLRATMLKRGDVILTHNHPNNSPFSTADITLAITYNAKEIRACLPTGGAWVLRRPRGGWATPGPASKLMATLDLTNQLAAKRAQHALDKLLADGRRDRMGPKRKRDLHIRLLFKEVVRAYNEFGADYGWRVEFQR